MGWSCSHRASCRLQAIIDSCFAQTGSSNTFKTGRNVYFYEIGKEQSDGAITGTVMKMLEDGMCKRSSSFRIEPNGKMLRGPKAMKSVPIFFVKIDNNIEEYYKSNLPVSDETLRQYVMEWVEQWKVGGVNSALAAGRIPYPSKAKVTDVDGNVLATWKAGMFQVW